MWAQAVRRCGSIPEAPGAKPGKALCLVPSSGVMLQQPACSTMEWLSSTFKAVRLNAYLLDAPYRRGNCRACHISLLPSQSLWWPLDQKARTAVTRTRLNC